MKLKYIILVLFLTSFTNMKSQSKLEIEITGLRSNKGYVAVDFLDKNNKTVKGIKGEIINKKCTVEMKDIKNDMYAIRFFHDENSNEKIDKNFIGIPKEGFGLSNDGLGKFGPKDFEEWLIPITGDTKITIVTKYF
jgi:uncharacterized protein (DUF2141 family)